MRCSWLKGRENIALRYRSMILTGGVCKSSDLVAFARLRGVAFNFDVFLMTYHQAMLPCRHATIVFLSRVLTGSAGGHPGGHSRGEVQPAQRHRRSEGEELSVSPWTDGRDNGLGIGKGRGLLNVYPRDAKTKLPLSNPRTAPLAFPLPMTFVAILFGVCLWRGLVLCLTLYGGGSLWAGQRVTSRPMVSQ